MTPVFVGSDDEVPAGLSHAGRSVTLPSVTTQNTRPKLLDDLERLTMERYPEGLARRLQHQFRANGLDADAAVGDAIEIMVMKAASLDVHDARGYLHAIAFNLLRKASAAESEFSLDERDEEAGENDVERQAFVTDTVKFIKSRVERWELKNLRVTTLVIIESTFLGEPLSTEELAERVEDILGETVELATVRQWKKRGLDRLADELRSLGFED